METLSQQLINAAQIPSVYDLGGQPNSPRRPQSALLRIGLWPIISETEPELAMGIGLVLAALLERWRSLSVYRLVAQVDGDPSDYDWTIADSQFGVDDWELDGLDENVAVWGTFECDENHYRLTIEVEDDARDDDSTLTLSRETASLTTLLSQLSVMTDEVANWLEATAADVPESYQNATSADPLLLKRYLAEIFHFDRDYYLELWGLASSSSKVSSQADELQKLSNELAWDFATWYLAHTISRITLYEQTTWSTQLQGSLRELAQSFADFPVATVILGVTAYHLGERLPAFDILENSLSLHPQYLKAYITLAQFYATSNEVLSAIDVYQRAIEANISSIELYMNYGVLMDSLYERQIELRSGAERVSSSGRPFIERYVFTSQGVNAPSLRESCASYRHVVDLDPANVEALFGLVSGLIVLEDPETWSVFSKLIDQDVDGNATQLMIDQIPEKDLDDMITILEAASAEKPGSMVTRLNLVRAYLADGRVEEAEKELAAIDRPLDLAHQIMLSRLRLSVSDAEFESRIVTIQDILDAKGQVDTDDLEYLEALIEAEPAFSDAYKLLARGYLSWGEQDDALEVLLDGQKSSPQDVELVSLLAKTLWNAGEAELAFGYINQGLEATNDNPTLLALMGRLLFEAGEDKDAKDYLRRAELMDPSNSELVAARLFIANTLIRSKKT